MRFSLARDENLFAVQLARRSKISCCLCTDCRRRMHSLSSHTHHSAKPEAKEKFANQHDSTRPTHRWCSFLCSDSLSKERPLLPLPLLLKKELWCFLLMPLSVRLDQTLRPSHVACIHGTECRLTDTAGFGCVCRESSCLLDVFYVNEMCGAQLRRSVRPITINYLCEDADVPAKIIRIYSCRMATPINLLSLAAPATTTSNFHVSLLFFRREKMQCNTISYDCHGQCADSDLTSTHFQIHMFKRNIGGRIRRP